MDFDNVIIRQILKSGDTLGLGYEKCIIDTVRGEGTSCIVYEAMLDGRRVILKELYPRGLGIKRDTNNSLIIPDSQKENFEYYKTRLKRAFDIQLEFHNDVQTTNYTVESQKLYVQNNTLYIVMHLSNGVSYDKVCPANILAILETVKTLSCAIQLYHKKQLLHLDIKPQNFFVYPQTNQMISLFDFDSVMSKNEIRANVLSYSNGYAAPEVIAAKEYYGSCEDIDEKSDIFSIGAVLFEKIMGRNVSEDDSWNNKRWNFDNNPYLKNTVHQLRTGITEVFQKTLAENKEKRYQSVELLIQKLKELIKLTYISVYLQYQNISVSTSKSYYISRSKQITQIHESLQKNHIVYLCGIGGTGKSETAKEYAEIYLSCYDNTYFANYSSSLKQTVANLFFNGLDDREKEEWYFDIDKRYECKLNLLKSEQYSENTLIIIDNFDINSGGYANNIEVLKELNRLKIRFIFTTRGYKENEPQYIKIEDFSAQELKKMFFKINPQDKDSKQRQIQVEQIITKSYFHVMTIDLIAHLSKNLSSLQDYIALLDKDGIANSENISEKMKIENNKDENVKSEAVYIHIKDLFNFSVLTKIAKYIMINACFLPSSGMKQQQFTECIKLSQFCGNAQGISSAFFSNEEMEELIQTGWIKYNSLSQRKIVIHSLISEVIINELHPELTTQKCRNFFVSFLDMICEWGNKKLICHEAEEIISNEENFNTLSELNDNFYKVFQYIPPTRAIEYMAVNNTYRVDNYAVSGDRVFYFGIDEKYILSPNITLSFSHETFEYCIYLKTLVFTSKKANIIQMKFKNCYIENFEASDDSAYCSFDGVLYTSDMKSLIKCPPTKKKLDIPGGVKNICSYSFYENENIEIVNMPKSVVEIGWHAFDGCKNLKYINLPKYMERIVAYAFAECSSLEQVIIPNGIKYIEDSVFSGCKSLKSIKIPDSAEQIKETAFWGCIALEELLLSNNIKEIEKNAFYHCKSLKKLDFPQSLKSIGEQAFARCSKLREINIQNPETEIAYTAFLGCILLDDIPLDKIMGNTSGLVIEKEKNEVIIKSCSYSVSEVNIPPDVTVIGVEAFSQCINIQKICIPQSVRKIYGYAFAGCLSLKEVDMSYTPDTGAWTFMGCENLKIVKLCPNTEEIGMGVFKDCKKLKEIILPPNLKEINEEAFNGCCSLHEINVPSGVTQIFESAFKDCTALQSVILPDGLKNIWNECFKNTAISYIVIPKTVRLVLKHIFLDCPNLRSIMILNPKLDPKEWGMEFFRDNNKVKRKNEMQIYGYIGSPTESFAKKYNYEFIPITPELLKNHIVNGSFWK